uniref:ATP-binding cassette sub-family H member 10 n=1 Tax=Diaphorina citri TaxID=121845 RepID=A0A410GHT4_DIACI|nr:ATP-binding cassette sub-family H member 10 [Diaphorina citri]
MSGIAFSDHLSLAVAVRSAYKTYDNEHYVLKGLNLSVPENKIYSLLGPSGCGKTTLLHCLLGRGSLNAGRVVLKYRKISEIGHMPQNVALHKELTISELFLYYGMMFNMDEETVREKSRFLLKFLELPSDQQRVVDSLSGGQQRRVSFALSIFHDPKLLILDEPTVGLDPMLCESIWNMLREMTNHGKTIIITTHYIEEAKGSHMVGIMRRGKLLAEKDPLRLLEELGCEYLEDAFLQLCKEDELISEEADITPDLSYILPDKHSGSQTVNYDTPFSMHRFKAQFTKNLWMLRRALLITLFVLVLPFVQISTFQMATGADPIDLPIAFVNREMPYSNSHCSNLSVNIFSDCFMNETSDVYLSCNMLGTLRRKKLKLIEYPTLDAARRAVVKNDVWALLHFHENFTNHLATRFNDGTSVRNDTIEMANIDTYIDQSNQLLSHFIKTKMLQTYREVMKMAFDTCDLDPSISRLPIKFMDPIYGSENTSFRDYTGPSMLSLTAFYIPVLYTGAMLMFEKDGGLLERIMISGMKFSEIAASHFVIQIVFIVVQNFGSMCLMYTPMFFNSPFEGSVVTTYFLLLAISLVGMLFGFVIALLSKSQTDAAYFGIGCNFLMKFLCGMMWPTQGMNHFLQIFSYFLPITLATDALRSLGSRGWDITHPDILLGFGTTLLWIPILGCTAAFIMKKKSNWFE